MKQLVCEMCGGTNLVKEEGVFVCQNCRCKYSIEEAKKMMIEGSVEVTGEVSINRKTELENLLRLADDAFAGSNYDMAYTYYSQVLQYDYQNAYATFQKGLSSAYQSTLANIRVNELIESTTRALELQMEETTGEKEVNEFRIYMGEHIFRFCKRLHNLSVSHYNEFAELKSSAPEYWQRTSLIISLVKYTMAVFDLKTTAKDAEVEKSIDDIASWGIFCCNEMFKTLSYKDGIEQKGNDWVDGSPIYGDRFVQITADAGSRAQAANDKKYFEEVIANLPKNVAARNRAKYFFETRKQTKQYMEYMLEMIHQQRAEKYALFASWEIVSWVGAAICFILSFVGMINDITPELGLVSSVVSLIFVAIAVVFLTKKGSVRNYNSDRVELYEKCLLYPNENKHLIEQIEKEMQMYNNNQTGLNY